MERENTSLFYENVVTNDVEEALRRMYLKLLFVDSSKSFESQSVPNIDNMTSIERTIAAIRKLSEYKNGSGGKSLNDSREEVKLYRNLHSLEASFKSPFTVQLTSTIYFLIRNTRVLLNLRGSRFIP